MLVHVFIHHHGATAGHQWSVRPAQKMYILQSAARSKAWCERTTPALSLSGIVGFYNCQCCRAALCWDLALNVSTGSYPNRLFWGNGQTYSSPRPITIVVVIDKWVRIRLQPYLIHNRSFKDNEMATTGVKSEWGGGAESISEGCQVCGLVLQ